MTDYNCYLLTGAGFSKDFGGRLANEFWALLYQHPQIQNNQRIKDILWENRELGFEAALEKISQKYEECPEEWAEDYKTIQAIIREKFQEMDSSFEETIQSFNATEAGQSSYRISTLFKKFKVIFTTNQDMLFERSLINLCNALGHPGMKSKGHPQSFQGVCYQGALTQHLGSSPIQIPDGLSTSTIGSKAYVKLHGSHNWESEQGQLMIVGGRKEAQIESLPLFKWYFEEFKKLLSLPNSRLLILGHSLCCLSGEGRPSPLGFKTVRDSFPSYGSSIVQCLSCTPLPVMCNSFTRKAR